MDYFDYERIPVYDISHMIYDTYDIKEKILQPVVLQSCQPHLKNCFTLNYAQCNWNENKSITCPFCHTTSNNPADLRKDIREQVAQQFHSQVESVQIMNGILTHKYQRKKRFTDLIKNIQTQIPNFLLNMKKKFKQSNSISSIIQQQFTHQQKVIFWAYCLLDKVKIVLPVRILKCDHPECYELTSLLAYREQQERLQEEDKKKIIECCHPGCSNILNISTLKDLIDGMVLDVDLLNVLNKSPPCQFKFMYLPEKKQFYQEQQQDPIIKILYDSQLYIEEKQYQDLQGFTRQVQALTAQVIQGDIQPNQEKKLKQEMFKNKQINMVDPLSKQIIEFPVRCTKCIAYDQCMDVRSFVANHILSKQRKKVINKCILCGTEYQNWGVLDSKIVYFDQNILSKMFREMSYQQTGVFNYDGKQYMLEEFLSRQKLPRQQYLEYLQREGKGTIGEFSNLHCVSDAQKKLKIPLIIQNCSINSMIDFDTFYAKMVEIDFQIEDKTLTFCKCQQCNFNPIKSYAKSLYYHEAFGEALKKYQEQTHMGTSFQYDFQIQKIHVTLQQGFLKIQGDKEYDEFFKPKQIQGKTFQILKMEQEFLYGIYIAHEKGGIDTNLDEQIELMNDYVNPILKEFKYEVKKIEIKLDDSSIKLNTGKFYQTK